MSLPPPADRRVDPLVELCYGIQNGDVAAFEQLFRAMHAPLCEVADSYVRSQAIAEEIIQDLFFVLWMKRDRIPRPEAMRAYLFTAARNRSLHHLRHRAVVRRWSARSESHPDVAGTAQHSMLPDEVLETQERGAALRRAIDQLAPRTRLAVVLRLDHGMSHAEVASAMGITIKGVEKLLAAAKAKLRALLGPHADSATWDR